MQKQSPGMFQVYIINQPVYQYFRPGSSPHHSPPPAGTVRLAVPTVSRMAVHVGRTAASNGTNEVHRPTPGWRPLKEVQKTLLGNWEQSCSSVKPF